MLQHISPRQHTHTTGHRKTLTFIHSLSSDFLIQFRPQILAKSIVFESSSEVEHCLPEDGQAVARAEKYASQRCLTGLADDRRSQFGDEKKRARDDDRIVL